MILITEADLLLVFPEDCSADILCSEEDIVRLLSSLDTTKAILLGWYFCNYANTATAIAPMVTFCICQCPMENLENLISCSIT